MEAPVSTDSNPAAQPHLPVRRLHNYVYCPRLCYFQWVENLFQENADTIEGTALHSRVDAPSRMEDLTAGLALAPGTKIRSLRLESDALGLIGVADIVEGSSHEGVIVVDYKKGSARRGAEGQREAKEPDAVQVMAHALLLEEQGVLAQSGAIYYAADKRRVPVPFTPTLRAATLTAIQDAKALAASPTLPPPLVNDPRCLYCSAYSICLPQESAHWASSGGPTSAPPMSPGPEPDPALPPPPRPERDDGEILVVHTPGAKVGIRADQLIVSLNEQIVRKLPSRQVRGIYLYGAIQLSAQAAQLCLEQTIDVSYFSPAGRFLGLLRGLPASGVAARLAQYRLFQEPTQRLRLAQEIIRGKIHNQRVLLMRNGAAPDHILRDLAHLRDTALPATQNLTALLGVEGAAAALYFQHFPTMLKAGETWRFDFTGRNRRPPRDPVNALLSLGYSMLAKELAGVCHTVGLDPFMGFLHQPRYGRPALALDLMEEFRPLIPDSVALTMLNRGEVSHADFIHSANGTFLNEHGRRAFWEAWFRRMDTEVTHPHFGYKMSYRRMLEVQARQLWRYLRGEADTYTSFTTR